MTQSAIPAPPPGFVMQDQATAIPPPPAGFVMQGIKKPAIGEASPSIADQLKRQLGLTGRAIAEGVVDTASPLADPLAAIMNTILKATGSDYRFPEQSQAFSQKLTELGVPAPQGIAENIANTGGRFITSAAASGPITKGVSELAPSAPAEFVPTPKDAATAAGKVLQKNGIPLDKAQLTGNAHLERLRSAAMDNPVTTGAQQAFSEVQQKSFNKAVLRSIGANSDEASQEVMAAAKKSISDVFDSVGKKGAVFDNTLQNEMGNIVDEAHRTVVNKGPLLKNVEDILNAVGPDGKIDGSKFITIRSNLSKLSAKPDVGESARDLQDALLSALWRSNPTEKAKLSDAIGKWRSMRVIEGAITKDFNGNISPKALANSFFTMRNRAASVYGQGGDQNLIELAKAAKTVLPEKLPQSGTTPRGLLQAPLRSLATAAYLKPLQSWLLAQPKIPTPSRSLPLVLPTSALLNRATK